MNILFKTHKLNYKFNNKKLSAASKPPNMIIIKLNPKIQCKLNIIELKRYKKIRITINSVVNIADNRLLTVVAINIIVKHKKIENNFDQNNILIN